MFVLLYIVKKCDRGIHEADIKATFDFRRYAIYGALQILGKRRPLQIYQRVLQNLLKWVCWKIFCLNINLLYKKSFNNFSLQEINRKDYLEIVEVFWGLFKVVVWMWKWKGGEGYSSSSIDPKLCEAFHLLFMCLYEWQWFRGSRVCEARRFPEPSTKAKES